VPAALLAERTTQGAEAGREAQLDQSAPTFHLPSGYSGRAALPVADHQLSHSPFWAQSCEWYRLWESNPNKPAAAPASTATAVQWPRVV